MQFVPPIRHRHPFERPSRALQVFFFKEAAMKLEGKLLPDKCYYFTGGARSEHKKDEDGRTNCAWNIWLKNPTCTIMVGYRGVVSTAVRPR